MAESEFLSSQELRDLTDCAQREAQKDVLRREGVPFREVGRRLVVSRLHARAWLEGASLRPNIEAAESMFATHTRLDANTTEHFGGSGGLNAGLARWQAERRAIEEEARGLCVQANAAWRAGAPTRRLASTNARSAKRRMRAALRSTSARHLSRCRLM